MGDKMRIFLFFILLFAIMAALFFVCFLVDPSGFDQKVTEYRDWFRDLKSSGIAYVFGGLGIIGGLQTLGGTGRKKGGPLGGSHIAETMVLGEHNENPWKRMAARKLRDIITR